jgi:hypothetical protein
MLAGFLVQCVEALPNHLHVQPITGRGNVMRRRLEVEADAMASFVQKKANKQWSWIAMDARSRQVIAFHIAAVSVGARAVCGSRPLQRRQEAQ